MVCAVFVSSVREKIYVLSKLCVVDLIANMIVDEVVGHACVEIVVIYHPCIGFEDDWELFDFGAGEV